MTIQDVFAQQVAQTRKAIDRILALTRDELDEEYRAAMRIDFALWSGEQAVAQARADYEALRAQHDQRISMTKRGANT